MAVLKMTCTKCGNTNEIRGEQSVAEMLKSLDEVHNLLRPDCEEAQKRKKVAGHAL